jgi:heme A synthase
MASDSLPVPLRPLDQAPVPDATSTGAAPAGRRRLRVQANSRLHWALLLLNVAGALIFYVTFLVEGALRPGYDALAQPVSALSLGPGGWGQGANFVVFGIVGCLTSFAWAATLAGGLGQTWVPRLQFLAGAAMIVTGLFAQDPANGYPVGAVTPVHPSAHAQIHLLASYVSFLATVITLVVIARRLAREPGWRWWATSSIAATVWMVACLATFGALIAQHGPGGVFEKLAPVPATLVGIVVTARLVASRDARLARPTPAQ